MRGVEDKLGAELILTGRLYNSALMHGTCVSHHSTLVLWTQQCLVNRAGRWCRTAVVVVGIATELGCMSGGQG